MVAQLGSPFKPIGTLSVIFRGVLNWDAKIPRGVSLSRGCWYIPCCTETREETIWNNWIFILFLFVNNLDFNYTFPIDFVQNIISLGAKPIEDVYITIQMCFDLTWF